MPRPVLSETTFNSDNIATSILQQANLQIANSSLGITDQTNSFLTYSSGWNVDNEAIYSFNGFVFLSFFIYNGGTVNHGDTVATISDSNFYPHRETVFNTYSSQDFATRLYVDTNGNFKLQSPSDNGGSNYHLITNGVYRVHH
jgi:hypothetical protein